MGLNKDALDSDGMPDKYSCENQSSQDPASSRVRLLYVEDNDDLREIYGLRLRRAGAEVTAVASAAEALSLSSDRENFDVLVIDLNLGIGLSGTQLARRLCERWPLMKVIVTTGDSGSDEARAVDPSWLVLEKPVSAGDLTAALAQVPKISQPGSARNR